MLIFQKINITKKMSRSSRNNRSFSWKNIMLFSEKNLETYGYNMIVHHCISWRMDIFYEMKII